MITKCSLYFLVGLIAWNTGILGFGLLLFIPYLWVNNSSRLSTFLTMSAYYAGATSQLLAGAENYFAQGIMGSFVLWAALQLALASGWIIFWKMNLSGFSEIFARLLLTTVVTIILPPFLFIGIAHPITAAGLFFPGMGFLGIFVYVVLTALVAKIGINLNQHRSKQISTVSLGRVGVGAISFSVIFMAFMTWSAITDAKQLISQREGRVAVDTTLGEAKVGILYSEDYERHLKLKSIAEEMIGVGNKIVIFPEMVAGKWTLVERDLWNDVNTYATLHNSAVLLGAENVVSDRHYDNALIILGRRQLISQSMIKARLSMPYSTWNPFATWSATLNISKKNNGVVVIKGQPTAVLICYEQMVVWPILQSMSDNRKPQLIIAVSNLWWARNTRIPNIMENTTALWGRLFAVPILRAMNT